MLVTGYPDDVDRARALRAFPGKVDTGFPLGNATNIESRALSGHDPCNFRVNLIGKRSNNGVVCYLRKPADEKRLIRCLRAALQSGEPSEKNS